MAKSNFKVLILFVLIACQFSTLAWAQLRTTRENTNSTETSTQENNNTSRQLSGSEPIVNETTLSSFQSFLNLFKEIKNMPNETAKAKSIETILLMMALINQDGMEGMIARLIKENSSVAGTMDVMNCINSNRDNVRQDIVNNYLFYCSLLNGN